MGAYFSWVNACSCFASVLDVRMLINKLDF